MSCSCSCHIRVIVLQLGTLATSSTFWEIHFLLSYVRRMTPNHVCMVNIRLQQAASFFFNLALRLETGGKPAWLGPKVITTSTSTAHWLTRCILIVSLLEKLKCKSDSLTFYGVEGVVCRTVSSLETANVPWLPGNCLSVSNLCAKATSCWQSESGVNLLILLSDRKRISTFPKTSNCSFNSIEVPEKNPTNASHQPKSVVQCNLTQI